MKIKYAIPTPYGTETRTSHREYTHVVVAGSLKAAEITRLHAETVTALQNRLVEYKAELAKGPDPRNDYAKWIRDLEARLAVRPAQALLALARPRGLIGYAGSLKLAQKLTTGWDVSRHMDIQIIEIKPEHKTPVVPRKASA
jgi:hypothetical protein